MSTLRSPGSLELGREGVLNGRLQRVRGRARLSMTDRDGFKYYWNEYYLVDDGGVRATLVHEVTTAGVVWKYFGRFEPAEPLGPEEAARVLVGQRIRIDGVEALVTLRDESRVEDVEGDVPETIRPGATDTYFNAEAGDRMYVVSWDGRRIEHYVGFDLPRGAVERAFGLPVPPVPRSVRRWSFTTLLIVLVALVVIGAVVVNFGVSKKSGSQPPESLERSVAGAPRWRVGSSLQMDGATWQVVGRMRTEIRQVGRQYERHEYIVRSDEGARALLFSSLRGMAADTAWLRSVVVPAGVTGVQAANLRQGQLVDLVLRQPGRVATLFESRVLEVEGIVDDVPAGTAYGLVAVAENTLTVARWDEQTLWIYTARPAEVSP